MKKRILSIFLSFALALSLLPATALATAEPLTFDGTVATLDLTDYSATGGGYDITISQSGIALGTGTGSSAAAQTFEQLIIKGTNTTFGAPINITGVPAGATITLQDLSWTNSTQNVYLFNISADTTLDIAGTVALSGAGAAFNIAAGKTLTLTGSGALSATSANSAAVEGNSDSSNGKKYSGKLVTSSYTGSLSLTGTEAAVRFLSEVTLETGGALTLAGADASAAAVTTVAALTLSGSTVALTGTLHVDNTFSSVSGVSGALSVTAATGGIAMNTGANTAVTAKSVSLTATKGDISVTSTAQAIYATDGSVTLSAPAGSVTVSGASADNGAIYAASTSDSAVTTTITAYNGITVSSTAGYAVYGTLTATADTGNISLTTAATSDGAVVKSPAALTATNGSITLTSTTASAPGSVMVDMDTDGNRSTVYAPKGIFSVIGSDPVKTYIYRTAEIDSDYIESNGHYDWLTVSSHFALYTNTSAGSGLDLSTNTPSVAAYYPAGDGYVIYTPAGTGYDTDGKSITVPADVTLYNATISNSSGAALTLPSGALTITAKGTSTLTGSTYGILQDDSNGAVTIQGSGTLTASGNTYDISLAAGLTINTTGTVDAPNTCINTASSSGTLTCTEGTFNAIVNDKHGDSSNSSSYTVCGGYTLNGDFTVNDMASSDGLTVPASAALTIPAGTTLTVADSAEVDGVPQITNNGMLVNNGTIVLPSTYANDMSAAIKALNLKGTGIVKVVDSSSVSSATYYNNSGTEEKIVAANDGGSLAPSSTATLAQDGYTYSTNGADNTATLTLADNTIVDANLLLSNDCTTTLKSAGTTNITGNLAPATDGPCSVDIVGGTLNVSGGLNTPTGTNAVTVEDNAKVNFGGEVTISGGYDGSLTVKDGASLTANSVYGSALAAGTITISGNASVDAYSTSGPAVSATNGSISVTGGSTLKTHCKYGVYVKNGKFTVDSNSTYSAADCTTAAIYVFDSTGVKTQDEVLSLANLPAGDEIAHIAGTAYPGQTHWSVIATGSTLGVTDENNDPATLTNAVKTLTLKASSNNNNGGGGTSSYSVTATAGAGGSITPSGKTTIASGSSLTYAVAPDNGYSVLDVLVDGKSVGAVTSYSFTKVAADHTISATFFKNYSDVGSDDWYKDAVDYVTRKGLMDGTGDDRFSPALSTTRGMIVTILWRMAGKPDPTGTAAFPDVAAGAYYADAVNWAAENKIVLGYSSGSFGPEDLITREQLAAIFYRYAAFKSYDTTQGGMAIREYDDYESISDYALTAMDWAVNAGLLNGSENHLYPQSSATRAQVAAVLMRFMQNLVK